jgi:hypothetical protein
MRRGQTQFIYRKTIFCVSLIVAELAAESTAVFTPSVLRARTQPLVSSFEVKKGGNFAAFSLNPFSVVENGMQKSTISR